MERQPPDRRRLALWLSACAALVLVTLVQGGVTRLTRSGLSIVEWKPVTGIVPPLGEAAWEREFAKYRATPEFEWVNPGMDLDGFRDIFWMEWAHRLLARATASAFLFPLLFLLARRRLERALARRLAGLGALVLFQGFLGWFMVSSGLVRDPHVSHYRLTAHLLTACAYYAGLVWTALDLLWPRPADAGTRPRAAAGALALTSAAVASGGLVAGLKAGRLYGTFPFMGGRLIPAELLTMRPLLRNFVDNDAAVQFQHRLLGLAAASVAVLLWRRPLAWPAAGPGRNAARALAGLGALQAALGILTLLRGVPVGLAAAHQGNALLVLGALLAVVHQSQSR